MDHFNSRYLKIIQARCDAKNAFTLSENSQARIGHLITLSFDSGNKQLVADTVVRDPEDFVKKNSVAGVFDFIKWDGNDSDPIEMELKISHKNKAILQEALYNLTNTTEISAEWVIYDYDYSEKKYFKRFYCLQGPIRCCLREDSEIFIDEDSNTNYRDHTEPISFFARLSLTPQKTVPDQKVGFAFSASGDKFSRIVGV